MKYTAAALIALVSADAVAGFSVSRSSLRQMSQPKTVVAVPSSQQQQQTNNVGASLKMEGTRVKKDQVVVVIYRYFLEEL